MNIRNDNSECSLIRTQEIEEIINRESGCLRYTGFQEGVWCNQIAAHCKSISTQEPNCKENIFENMKGKKRATEKEGPEGRRNSTNDHVRSMISPGVKMGFASFFIFFWGRLSFNCFLFLIFLLINSPWQSQWHKPSIICCMKSKSVPKLEWPSRFLSNCLHPSPSPSHHYLVQIHLPFSL